VVDSCRYCGHKSRHRKVAIRHVCRVHGTRSHAESKSNLPLRHGFTPDLSSWDAQLPSTNEPCPAQTVTSGSLAERPQSTIRCSDTDEQRQYRIRLVRATVSRTLADDSVITSGEFDLRGPPMDADQQVMPVQSWSTRWNRTWTSDSHRRVSSETAPSASYSSFSRRSSPAAVGSMKLDQSDVDSPPPEACHSDPQLPENTDDALYQNQIESAGVSYHSTSVGSAAARFSCPMCSLTYKRIADLNRHMKQKHRTTLSV